MCCTLVPVRFAYIRFSVRSAHAFASGFFSAPLTGIQLPLATLRRYLTGAGLASLISSNFPLGLTPCKKLVRSRSAPANNRACPAHNNRLHDILAPLEIMRRGVGDQIQKNIEYDRATAYGISMKVFKVVLDTNVLVSGLRSKRGASHKLLTLLGAGRFTTAVSVPLVVEYEKALVDPRTKVPFSRADIGKFIDYTHQSIPLSTSNG